MNPQSAMPTRRAVIGAGVAALGASRPASADDGGPLMEDTHLFMREGRYLPWARVFNASPDQYAALIGDERAAFALNSPNPLIAPTDWGEIRVVDAIPAIVAAARRRRVVILNEAHQVSRDRLFALQLATALRPHGFDVFAGETFQTAPDAHFDAINSGAPVATWSGTYTADPVYAETVRSCRELGYRFAPYEAIERDSEAVDSPLRPLRRELGETTNLVRLIRSRPSSRFLVYCGFGHASKRKVHGFSPLARQLTALLDTPPLTIDQSWGAPAPDPGLTPVVQQLIGRFAPDRTVAVLRGDGPFQPGDYQDGAFDFDLLHPALPYVAGRPGWLASAPGRRRVDVALAGAAPLDALAQAAPLAELERERATVPADQYPIRDAQTRSLTFWLRPGRYLVRLETPAGFTEVARLSV